MADLHLYHIDLLFICMIDLSWLFWIFCDKETWFFQRAWSRLWMIMFWVGVGGLWYTWDLTIEEILTKLLL